MVKVIQKTFSVLEYISQQNHSVLPAELVANLKLTQPVICRILKDLVSLGYLVQTGSRKGYQLGPVPYQICSGNHYQQDFYIRAQPMLQETARRIGQMVLFSIRHLHWRILLCHASHNPIFAIDPKVYRSNDLYRTVSGRVLLAYAPERDLEDVINTIGLPNTSDYARYWPEAAGNRSSLDRELIKIRQDGYSEAVLEDRSMQIRVYARPVISDGQFIGAIAANFPGDEEPELLKRFYVIISELAESLSQRTPRTMIWF